MDYEKKYKEALEKAREIKRKIMSSHLSTESCKAVSEYIDTIIPELRESEDARIRKCIEMALTDVEEQRFLDYGTSLKDCLCWLKKQKERDLDIVPELRPTAWGEGYQHGCKDTEEKYSGMVVVSQEEWDTAIADAFKHGMDEGEKQKEHKEENLRDFIDNFPYSDKQKEQMYTPKFKIGDKIHFINGTSPNYEDDCITIREIGTINYIGEFKEGYVPIKEQDKWELVPEQKPVEHWQYVGEVDLKENKKEENSNIELIQKSWYMEGYHDCEFGYEPRWIIKTGEGGPRYEENPKYGQHIEEKSMEWKPQPESLEALMYAIEGKWEMIKPTSDLSRRLEDLYEGLVNAYNVDKSYLTELHETALTGNVDELRELKNKIEASMDSAAQKKQDYSGLNDFEGAIHRGFLCAGVENVPVNIIKETAQDCLAHLSAEWSEEDEKIRKTLLDYYEKALDNYTCVEWLNGITYGELCDWLKSIPKRFNLQPKQEWSEEDEKHRQWILECLADGKRKVPEFAEQYQAAFVWLKSLRPSWKPSEEQMKALNALNCHGDLSYVGQQNQLISLYNDLKKLM